MGTLSVAISHLLGGDGAVRPQRRQRSGVFPGPATGARSGCSSGPESVFGLRRNQCSASAGMGVRLASESVFDMARCTHQAARIPKFGNLLVADGDILSTVGWLHLVAAEADGDYHIQISPTHEDDQGTNFLIVEVPTPEAEFVADTSLHPRLEAVRSLIRERMLRGSEPSTRGSLLAHPAC